MMLFSLWATLLVLLVLAGLAWPLWRSATQPMGEGARQQRYAVHQSELAELLAEHQQDRLDETAYRQAIEEAGLRLLLEMPPAQHAMDRTYSGRWLLAVALLLPLMAGGLYLHLGNPAAAQSMAIPTADEEAAQISRMVQSLESKLAINPQDDKGWLMLARSYRTLQRYDDAVKAYEKAWPLVENNAGELARFAGTLAVAQNGFAGRPTDLLVRALTLNPKEVDALMLSGSAALERGDIASARQWWQQLLSHLPADSDDARWIQQKISELPGAAEQK
ncbi:MULTISPECIES: c-type cytochrome biogenesis protein CcmI [Chitinibacter]|uniref:c-type cytochrome biogenesis protein CcmI n=1 Tax=Chitinibacter TaxID=230666 RepID=UPI0006488136|nr:MULTISPECIES: c-type cytochrome biogenesis protein CcmI [Chitinibacter]